MDIKEQFEELYEKWYTETCIHSNAHFIINNENFKKIEELGKENTQEVVPLIIDKLRIGRGVFLTTILDKLLPGVITVTGYVNPVEYAQGWVNLYDIMKSAEENGREIESD